MLTIAAAGLIALTATLGAGPAKAPPPANQLYGVSCPSANDCVAVGINENAEVTVKGGGALIQTWNGASWTMARPPEPKGSVTGEPLKVSCPSATDCLAVGLSGSDTAESALADRWNGKSWTRTPVRPRPAPSTTPI